MLKSVQKKNEKKTKRKEAKKTQKAQTVINAGRCQR